MEAKDIATKPVMKNENSFTDLLKEMDGGLLHPLLEQMSRKVALGTYAAEDMRVTGEVNLKLKFSKIKGTGQLMLTSTISNASPTRKGKTTELITGETAVHVSITDRGAMTIMPDNQLKLGIE